ncbi:MAG TPA: hypothetical protein VGG25_02950 [Streptosporangiaceae bacterium]
MSSSIEQAAAAGAGDPAEPPADSASDAGATLGARKKPGTGAKPNGSTVAAPGTADAGQSAANGADAGTDAANGGPADERADVTVTDEDAAAEGRPGDERGADERGADERGAERHGAGDSGASESGASASRASENGAGGNGACGADGADADGWAGGRDDHGFLDDEPDTSWFLPAGRAALAPEAVTVDDGQLDREPASRRAGAATRVAGSPPWAGESAADGAQAPPPWESGPWHGSSEHPGAAGDEPAPGERQGAVPDGEPVGVADAAGQSGGSGSAGWAANPFAAGALITGVLGILVLPGLILGVLGLRRASVTGTGRIASWLGIALSLLWAAGIVLVAVPGSSAPPDPGCKSYQAHGRAAAAKVMAAIKDGKPASVLDGELHHAAVVINKAAAKSWTLNVRNALSSLTDDLQAADDQVSGGGQVPSQLAGELSADASAADSVCGS